MDKLTARAEVEFLKDKIAVLEETITTQSVKTLVVCGLELYLTQALALSLFECVDPDMRDDQELQYMTNMAWIPLLWGILLVFGHRVLPSVAPAPENLDQNLRNSKLLTFVYSLLFLIWDKDMTVKRGPALEVAVAFLVCDLARYEMEIAHLIEDDEEELLEDRQVDTMAHAVSIAGVDEQRETEFKNQLQAVSNRDMKDDSDDNDDDDRTHSAAYVNGDTPVMKQAKLT